MSGRVYIKDRSWMGRLRSFKDAFRGLAVLVATQPNARVHAALTIAALALGWWLALAKTEWLFLVMAIGLVWVAEGFNTAIEFLVDMVSPEMDPRAGRVKDVAAGAVLAAAVTAIAVGALIFFPKLARMW